MKRDSVFSRALTLYRNHFGKCLMAVLLQLILRAMCLAPLLFLMTKELPWAALLCPLMLLLLVLPVRQNTAEAMLTLEKTGDFELVSLFSMQDYGRKLKQGLRAALPLVLWFLPFIAATAFLIYVFKAPTIEGFNDVMTLVRTLMNLGRTFTFNSSPTVSGVICVLLMYAVTLLPGLIGLGFHSGLRHSFAMRQPKAMRGHRVGVLGWWFAGVATLLPFAVVTVITGRNYMQMLVKSLSNLMGGIHLPPLDSSALMIAAAFVVLCLPVIPLKSLITAVYVHRFEEREGD